MSYIGNQITSVPFTIDLFSGTGGQTLFGPMTFSPATHASVMVFISGVYKIPVIDYTVNGNYITFNSAPALGTNNIVVHHLGNGVMATQVPADGTVISSKIGTQQVQGNQIGLTAVSGNNLGLGAVSGNNIGINSINASNSITELSITGNLVGLGAISANNFAGGGITSNVLSSNLSVSLIKVTETININSAVVGSNSQSGTNVNIDINNCTSYYFTSNTTGNVTFNLRGNTINTFDSSVETGNTVSVVISLRHNVAAYRSGVNVMIDGGYIRTTVGNPDNPTGNILFYSGNTTANHSPIDAIESNVIGISVIKKGANSYVVYMSNTLFGLVGTA